MEALRPQIRAAIIADGLTPAQADEITDLALHAVQSAVETVWNVTGRGSTDGIRTTAVGLALQVAVDVFAAQSKACHEYAVAKGYAASDHEFTL